MNSLPPLKWPQLLAIERFIEIKLELNELIIPSNSHVSGVTELLGNSIFPRIVEVLSKFSVKT